MSKHFTTNSVLRDERAAKRTEAIRVQRERKRRAEERAALMALQRKFAARSGRAYR